MTLLASKRVLTSVVVKSEDIKKEKVDSEPIVVNSSSSDEGSSTSDARKRKASSKNAVEAAPRHAPSFHGPAGNPEKAEAYDDSDWALSSHKAPSQHDDYDSDMSDPQIFRDPTTGRGKVGASEQRHRKKTVGQRVRRPYYTKSKQRRDISYKNRAAGMRRQASDQKIQDDINEATADNLP
jgi:hypothetical protein